MRRSRRPRAARPYRGSRTRTINVQERTNGETRRRSRAVQVFPSEASPARLVEAVLCEQDEEWSGSRYLSEEKISELYDDRPEPGPPTEERSEELRLVAERAIKASLEIADRMEATQDTGQGLRSCR